MSFRIVSDSSSNVLSMGASDYTTVPLKIIAEKEYIDDENVSIDLKKDETVKCLFEELDDSYVVTIKSLDKTVLHCIIKYYK